MTTQEAIDRIKAALGHRTDRGWSVTSRKGDRGWITVTARKARLNESGSMSVKDRDTLVQVFGVAYHWFGADGLSVSPERREEFVLRSEGEWREPEPVVEPERPYTPCPPEIVAECMDWCKRLSVGRRKA